MSSMVQRVSPAALQALKEALSTIYWYKGELRSFLQNSLGGPAVLSVADWSGYKRQIVSDIVDHLASDQDKHLGQIRSLLYDVSQMKSFTHLERLDDGDRKASIARQAVDDLRELIETHDEAVKEKKAAEERRKAATKKLQQSKAVQEKLEEIKKKYINLVMSTDPQARGRELEEVMYEVFSLFDLDPKASFTLTGEQIDGAFSLDGTDYLFEAKWQKETVSRGQLDEFAGKVRRKLENTLGLFLSIEGFSQEGVTIHSTGRPQFILMTGADLMAVLEARIDLVSLLKRKKRHAAHTGKILLEIHEFDV